MATLKSIAGKNGCGDSGMVSTGTKGVQITFGTPKHAIKLKRGTVFPGTTEFTKEFLLLQIQKGIATPIMSAPIFERLSGEDAMSTTPNTVERLNVKGLPKYKLGFQEGHEFYRQLSKLTGFKNSDWLIIDDSGNMKIAINSNGDFVGFEAGQVNAEQVMEKTEGGDGESKAVTIQFIDRNQWDTNYTIVTQSQLGINWREIEGANPVILEWQSVPVVGATKVSFTALFASDKCSFIEGLTSATALFEVDGIPVVPSVFTESAETKSYSLTIPAVTLDQKLSIKIHDDSLKIDAVQLADTNWTSNTATVTVIAST